MLSGYVDKVIFCDINPRLNGRWERIRHKIDDINLSGSNSPPLAANGSTKYRIDTPPLGAGSFILPTAEFIVGNAREVCSQLPVIDILFYRRDSTGEGGSALFVLGDMFLRPILQHFPLNGGLIFTDGSNSRGGNFKKMVRRNGLIKHGWKFLTTPEQPYFDSHGLWRISVSPWLEQPSNE